MKFLESFGFWTFLSWKHEFYLKMISITLSYQYKQLRRRNALNLLFFKVAPLCALFNVWILSFPACTDIHQPMPTWQHGNVFPSFLSIFSSQRFHVISFNVHNLYEQGSRDHFTSSIRVAGGAIMKKQGEWLSWRRSEYLWPHPNFVLNLTWVPVVYSTKYAILKRWNHKWLSPPKIKMGFKKGARTPNPIRDTSGNH